MLDLVIDGDGAKQLAFEVRLQLMGGFSSRNQEAAQEHLDELKKEGITITVTKTPVFFPKLKDRITTSDTVEVLADSKTCGEAEPVLLLGKDNEIYIAAGSDHSDRELEKHDMVVSKQMCPNVISSSVWRYQDVKAHWDDLILRGWVVEADGKRQLYQEAKMGAFMTVEDFLAKAKERIKGDPTGAVIFMGTVATLAGKLIFTPGFEVELVDEHTGRTLTCAYSIAPTTWYK